LSKGLSSQKKDDYENISSSQVWLEDNNRELREGKPFEEYLAKKKEKRKEAPF